MVRKKTIVGYSEPVWVMVSAALKSLSLSENGTPKPYAMHLSDGAITAGKEFRADMASRDKLQHFLFSLITMGDSIIGSNKCPIGAYLIGRALQDDGHLCSASRLSQIMAPVVYMFSAVHYGQALMVLRAKSSDSEPSLIAEINRLTDEFLNVKRPCSFSLLIRTFCNTKNIATSEIGNTAVQWSDDCRKLTVDGLTLDLTKIQPGMARARGDIERLLRKFSPEAADLQLPESFSEDGSNMDVGFGLADRLGQIKKIDAADLVYNRSINAPGSARSKFGKKQDMKARMRAETEAITKLLVPLVHITGGQPARGNEIASYLVRNSTRPRNVIVLDGKVCVITRLTKSTKDKKDHYGPHELPKWVGDIVIKYVWAVKPVQRLTIRRQGDEATRDSQYFLFTLGGKEISSVQVSSLLAKFTENYFGTRLGIRRWRQASPAISHKFLGPAPQDTIIETAAFCQAGHSKKVSEQHYAVESGGKTRRATQILEACRAYSRKWHQLMEAPLPKPYSSLVTQFVSQQPKDGPSHTDTDDTFQAPMVALAVGTAVAQQVDDTLCTHPRDTLVTPALPRVSSLDNEWPAAILPIPTTAVNPEQQLIYSYHHVMAQPWSSGGPFIQPSLLQTRRPLGPVPSHYNSAMGKQMSSSLSTMFSVCPHSMLSCSFIPNERFKQQDLYSECTTKFVHYTQPNKKRKRGN